MRTGSFLRVVCAVGILCASCQRELPEGFLGSAVIESQTYQVASVVQGEVLSVLKQEGEMVKAGELCAVIDTVPTVLHLQDVNAKLAELDLLIAARRAELGSQKTEIRGLAREFGRIGELADKGSIPTQQKDDLGTKVQASDLKLKAAQNLLASLAQKRKGIEANIALLENQREKCSLRAMVDGVVVSRYKNPGEVVGPGMPVLEIGRFDTLHADFYIPQYMLAGLKYAQGVRIRLDRGGTAASGGEQFVPAVITWISDEAEFSPKNIQTRQSRHELVFRVRATAANAEGLLKRGLPVEIWK